MLTKLLLLALALLLLAVLAVAGGILSNRLPLTDPPGLGKRLAVYLGSNVAHTQPDSAFPELRTLQLRGDVEDLLPRIARLCGELGWTEVQADPSSARLQAVVRTPLLRFADDVTIELRQAGAGRVRLDARSASRVGRGDLGANTRHLMDLRAALEHAGLLDPSQ